MSLWLPRQLLGGPFRPSEGVPLLHRFTTLARWGLAIAIAFLLAISGVAAEARRPPNVVLNLADDKDHRPIDHRGSGRRLRDAGHRHALDGRPLQSLVHG